MSHITNILQSPQVIALLIAIFIFLTTILLVVKRWIGFSMTVLLLFFSLVTGLIINYQRDFQCYLECTDSTDTSIKDDSQDVFRNQMKQAVEKLKAELETEKEKLQHVMDQVQEIFDSMDAEKQKLQIFIEEMRERFKVEYPTKSTGDSQA